MADEQASPLDEIASVGSPHPAAPPAEPTEAPIASNLGNLDYRPEQQNQPPAGWPTYEPKPAEWSSPLDEIASVAPDKTSAIGAAGRSAARSAIPALTGLSATGSGAEIGGLIGAPLGPVGEAVGAVGGALVANYGGAKAADAVQNWALSKLPDSFVDAFGQNEKTQRLDQQQHPVASFVGGLIPYAVTMKPGPLFEKAALPENATALQRLLYNPVTARLFGGGVMGGMELASEAHDGQDLDWRKVGIATAFGTIWNKPTKLGEAITEIGAGPTRRVLGRPSPTVAQAGDLKVMGPGITEKVFQGTHEQAPEASMTAQETARAEHAALGEPPEPDVGHIARRMEPELFGRYEELLKRREAFGAWAGEGPEVSAGEGLTAPQKHLADTNAEIEAMAPQIAAAYRRAAETAGTETSEAEPFPSYAAMIAAHEHGTGQPTVKPEVPNEQAGPVPEVQAQQAQPQEGAVPGVPGVPAGGEAPGGLGGPAGAPAPVAPRPQRSIGDQRAHIAGDVARRLIAAGRPPEEAEAAGHLIAARYVTRAGRFEGKLGTPEELYARESASIAGPRGHALTPAGAASEAATMARGTDQAVPKPNRGPAARDENTYSLLEFLASHGGIRSDEAMVTDLKQSFGGGNKFVPGMGQLIRAPRELSSAAKAGGAHAPMTLDHALEAATEAGYFRGENLTPRDLLDAIDNEARGNRKYKEGVTPEGRSADEHFEAKKDELVSDVEKHLKESGGTPLTDAEKARAIEIWHREGINDTADILERLALEADDEAISHGSPARTEPIPGWDAPHDGGAAPAAGAAARPEEPGGAIAPRSSESAAGVVQELFQRELEQKREGREHGKDFFQIKAYHGSPYDFDKFSLDKIGTGEGAQAYGHGLYFAENPKVAEEYADRLGKPTISNDDLVAGNYNLGPAGHRYEVNINADPEHFLDWDKPLSPAMQEKLRKAAGAIKPNLYERVMGTGRDLNKWALTENLEGRTGESALAMLHRGLRSDASASQALRDAGIPGIKYLDQGSRTAGGGSHNYVLFDDKAIEITHKDGKPVSANERKNIIDEMYQRQDDAKNLDQIARGKIRIAPGQRPLISLLKDANASTFVHESGHQFLEEMLRDAAHAEAPEVVKQDTETVKKWLGVGEDGIQTKHHEKFARGFEQYMREGVAPSQGLGRVFAQFRNWLLGLYQTIKGLGQEISPEIRSVFDRMLEMEPQRTVIAPERLQPDLLHDIHEAEATHTEPHEAEGAADRIVAESNRYLTEPPKEIQNELQAASGRVQQTEVESHPTTEPGGSTSAVTGQAVPSGPGAQALVDGGAGPGAEPGGGAGGAEHGAEQQGGAGPVSEGAAGAVGPDVRSKLGSHDGTALAPSPATLFGPEESPLVDKAGNIRIDNLTNRSDVAQAIRVAAQQNNEFIGDRRGVITDGQVLELADALGMDEASLNRRQLGQAFNAEQIVAARKLLVQSATHVSEAMKKAATGTDADVMAYAQAKDRHQMIQAQVAGITAEAGRALRAFRSIAGMDEAKQIGQFVQEATGKTLFQLKAEAKLGAQLQTPQQVSKFMQDAQKHTFGRMVLEYWINGLISGPATHMTYAVGNTISTLVRIPEQLVASGVGRAAAALGREGPRVHAGEAFEMAKAGLRELPSALKAGVEAVGTGVTTQLPGEHAAQGTLPFQPGSDLAQAAQFHEGATYHDALGAAFGLVRGMRDGLVSTGKLLAAGGIHGEPLVGTQYSPLGAIPDITLKGVNVLPIGSVVRAPGRLIAAIHSFYRSTNFSMEKAALAYRKGVEEGLDGEALASRVAQIRSDPSEAQMNEIAAHGATGTVLMGKGSELTQALSRVTNARIFGFPLLKFIDPFVHISGNIIEQSVIQRTPAGLLTLFNPETELARDLTGRNGGAAQDKAIGRMLVGSALSIAFGSLAAEGMMSGSGPKDPKESSLWRLAGNQAHSIRIGDFWYDTHKLGPLGMLAGISADLYDVAHDAEHGEFLKAAAHLQHAFAQNILDESFMRGPAELIQAIEDPGRYGEAYVRNFVASFVPFNVAASQITRATDPYTRQARTVTDAIKAKIPGLSETLYPRRDIWGEPMPSREVLGVPGVSAIYATRIKNDPVMTAMQQLNIFPGAVDKKIRNVELTPKEYDDFARIAGRLIKPALDKLVNSPSWATFPAEGKHYAIQHTIEANRDTAREMILDKYRHIQREAATIKQQRARGEKPQ